MTHTYIPLLLLGLLLATAARADLPAQLTQAATQIASTADMQQILVADLEAALKSGVAEQDLQSVMRLATTQKYSATHATAFVQQLAAVRRDGLPVTLMRDKILEGMAKKVPAENILAVASQWQGALKEARSNVQAMEERGLKFDKATERETLINLGAGLRQRYGAKDALPRLAESAGDRSMKTSGAGSLIAAGNLAELLFLHNATPAQALELPRDSLKAGYTPTQIQTLQRNVQDQLRQGMAIVDVTAGNRAQFDTKTDALQVKPSFSNPGQPPGGFGPGGAPGGPPGGGMPGGGMPGGAPGGGFSGGGPGGSFPNGGGGF